MSRHKSDSTTHSRKKSLAQRIVQETFTPPPISAPLPPCQRLIITHSTQPLHLNRNTPACTKSLKNQPTVPSSLPFSGGVLWIRLIDPQRIGHVTCYCSPVLFIFARVLNPNINCSHLSLVYAEGGRGGTRETENVSERTEGETGRRGR